jgi:predicted molibdopterin-dependent oxidoreductase YjgC
VLATAVAGGCDLIVTGDRDLLDLENSARVCHAASTVAMKPTVGFGATTCSYTDWIGSGLIVFLGSNSVRTE